MQSGLVRFDITGSDLANILFVRERLNLGAILRLIFFFFVISYLLPLIKSGHLPSIDLSSKKIFYSFLILLAIVVLYFFVRSTVIPWLFNCQVRGNIFRFVDLSFEWDTHSFEERNSAFRLRRKWADIVGFAENSSTFCLYASPSVVIVLPKRAFTSTAVAAFSEFLNEKARKLK